MASNPRQETGQLLYTAPMPHIHDRYDFVVTIFIVHRDKVLLVNHPRYDKWLPIGGHIELDEDPEQALFREVAEETGLAVDMLAHKPRFEHDEAKPILSPNYIDVHLANPPHKHISLMYFAVAHDDNVVLSHEHTDYKWLKSSDLEKPEYDLTESIRFYCRQAIKAAQI